MDTNREFPKEEKDITKKYLEICSLSLAVSEMQIKITLRFYLTPARISKTNKTMTSNTREPSLTVVGLQTEVATVKFNENSQKSKINSKVWPNYVSPCICNK